MNFSKEYSICLFEKFIVNCYLDFSIITKCETFFNFLFSKKNHLFERIYPILIRIIDVLFYNYITPKKLNYLRMDLMIEII